MRLYIDPGTGSMLFSILIGMLGTLGYLFRDLFVKLRFWMTGGAGDSGQDKDRHKYVIFSDDKRYWTTFEPICDEFEKRKTEIVYMTASPDDPALDKKYEYVSAVFIGEGNRAFARLNRLKADILISTTPGLDVYQWKRSRDVRWYAFVMHNANDATLFRMFGLDYYDEVFVSGEYQIEQIRKLEALRNLPKKELVLGGVPYLDSMEKKRSGSEKSGNGVMTVLLAPTWGKSGMLSRFGGRVIQAALDTGYHVIVRPHPQSFKSEKALMNELMKQYPDSSQLEWNRDNDNFNVLSRSDVMVSDFSGVIFDFCLVFQKPVIFVDTEFDVSPYDAYWLEDETWTFSTMPKLGKCLTADNLERLKDMINEVTTGQNYQAELRKAREETWANIGRSAQIITESLIEKEKELLSDANDERSAEKNGIRQ